MGEEASGCGGQGVGVCERLEPQGLKPGIPGVLLGAAALHLLFSLIEASQGNTEVLNSTNIFTREKGNIKIAGFIYNTHVPHCIAVITT